LQGNTTGASRKRLEFSCGSTEGEERRETREGEKKAGAKRIQEMKREEKLKRRNFGLKPATCWAVVGFRMALASQKRY